MDVDMDVSVFLIRGVHRQLPSTLFWNGKCKLTG